MRETFEEAGVLLAGPAEGAVVPDVSGDDWEEQRQALLSRDLSLTELLAGRGLVLRSDLLRPFAHWITPPMESRRYDTKFFAAALPAGQEARDVSGKSLTNAATYLRSNIDAQIRQKVGEHGGQHVGGGALGLLGQIPFAARDTSRWSSA